MTLSNCAKLVTHFPLFDKVDEMSFETILRRGGPHVKT